MLRPSPRDARCSSCCSRRSRAAGPSSRRASPATRPAVPGSRRRWCRKSGNCCRRCSPAVPVADRRVDPPLHFLRLAPHHRGLVRHADRRKCTSGSKPSRVRAREISPGKLLLVAAVADVIADVVRILQREHHEIMPVAALDRAGAVALVSSCEALPWMIEVTSSLAFCRTRFQTLITSPQVVSTIWQPFSLMLPSVGDIRAECRDDDHVFRCQIVDFGFLVARRSGS